jgi:AcrR family transcriptional regulator
LPGLLIGTIGNQIWWEDDKTEPIGTNNAAKARRAVKGDPRARRAAVLAAAGEAFATKGYAAATTLEIARLAKTSKRALYQHFADKRDILNHLVLERGRELSAPVEIAEPRSKAAFFEAMVPFGVAFLTRLVDPGTIALYRLALAEAGPSNDLGQALETRRYAPARESLRRFLEQGAARGWLGASDLDSVLDAYFDLLIGSTVMGQLLRTEPLPDQDALRRRAEFAATALRRLAMSF